MILTEGKTLQQVSDELANVLIKQGRRCVVNNKMNQDNEQCLYGDEKGNHCAIGWLLPEDNEELMTASSTIMGLVESDLHLGPNHNFIHEYQRFLLEVQNNLHDNPLDVDSYYYDLMMEGIEKQYSLDMSSWEPWLEMVNKESQT